MLLQQTKCYVILVTSPLLLLVGDLQWVTQKRVTHSADLDPRKSQHTTTGPNLDKSNMKLFVGNLLVLSILFVSVTSGFSASLAPFVFLPGYGASDLFARIDSEEFIPETCLPASLQVNQTISVTANSTLNKDFPECVWDLLRLDYDVDSHSYSQPRGISVFTTSLGGFNGITSNYWKFPKALAEWGYVLNKNLFGVPYDYRLMSSRSYEATGFIQALKNLIEHAYHSNGNKKVIIAGHSNGGPTMYSFLTSSIVPQQWKDQYIAAMISLSGNMLGQMNVIYDAVIPYTGNMAMEWSWEGNYGSLPWGDYSPVRDIPIVTTYYYTAMEKNYTSKLEDLVALFKEANQPDWAAHIEGMYAVGTMNRTAHPMVDVYCFYGAKLSTSYSFVFEKNVQSAGPIITRYMEGDDDQDAVDNNFCNVWNHGQNRYSFESEAFPGVGHMEMISDENVLTRIKEVVMKYSN